MINKKQITTLFLIIIFLFSFTIFSYAEEQAASPQTLTIQQLKEDTDYFFKTIEDTHPNLYYKLSKEDYDNYKKLCYEKINKPMSVEEYSKVLASFLNKVGDGHTRIGNLFKNLNKSLTFPFLTDWIDGHLVITKVFGDVPIKSGDIILYINDISAQEYLDAKLKIFSFNDYQWARRILAKWWVYSIFFDSKEKHKITVSHVNGKIFEWYPPVFSVNDSKIFGNEDLKSRLVGKKPFEFLFWKDINVGYLRWQACSDRQTYKYKKYLQNEKVDPKEMEKIPDFSEMLEKSFKQMDTNNSKYFIIDIRGNGGGNSRLGDQLLAYVTNKEIKTYSGNRKISKLYEQQYGNDPFDKYIISKIPFGTIIDDKTTENLEKEYSKQNKKEECTGEDFLKIPKVKKHFRGKLIILIDTLDFSSGEDFAVMCRDNNIGIFVGEPTGGGVTVPGDVLDFILPVSKIEGGVSFKMFIRPDQSRINERAVYPDYYVYQTLEDFRAGRDTVLEFVKKGIREKKF